MEVRRGREGIGLGSVVGCTALRVAWTATGKRRVAGTAEALGSKCLGTPSQVLKKRHVTQYNVHMCT